jgi:TolB-like protein
MEPETGGAGGHGTPDAREGWRHVARLFAELRRRNVFRVGAAYAVVAWLLLQIADILLDNFEAPGWVFKSLFVVLVVGFGIALVLAWAFELTPEGVKRSDQMAPRAAAAARPGRRIDRLIVVALAAVIAIMAVERIRFAGRDRPDAATGPAASAATRPSLAVLPFANRSQRAEDLSFTDGIHDELLTYLSRIRALKVISRTSVLAYRDTTRPLPDIARELGVSTILEGGVQRAGNHVRINVQLIDAASDAHLWAETYDRELTATNLFAIQSEISKAIAETLDATLSGDEITRLDRVPTTNLEAHQAYLLGREYFRRRLEGGSAILRRSIGEFERAIALEPGYAEAHAGLAAALGILNGYVEDPDPDHYAQSRAAAERALALNPNLGEAHAALGFYYGQSARDWLKAEEHLRLSIELQPGNADARLWLAFVYLTAGFVDEGHELFQSARELDPASAIVAASLSKSHDLKGELEAAIRTAEDAVHLGFAPMSLMTADFKLRSGDRPGAVAAVESVLDAERASAWIEGVLAAYGNPARVPEAVRMIRELYDRYGNSAVFAAHVLTNLGAVDAAIDIMEERLDAEVDLLVNAWRRDQPALRSSPRFKALLERARLPAYWRARGWPAFCRPLGDDDFTCGEPGAASAEPAA